MRIGLVVAALVGGAGAGSSAAEEPVTRLRAVLVGANPVGVTIELLRWSTDGERAPLLAALAPAPATPRGPAPDGGRGAGRGGRGGRGVAAPATPLARLATAIKAAPTVGFIWGDGPTGYAIKYAWRSVAADRRERLVLVTDRRLGAHAPSWPPASGPAADAEFTLIEMRIDANGAGEARTSDTSAVVVDAAANTLALDGYAAATVLLKVTR